MNKNRHVDYLFPVNLILKDKKCIIVGGGKIASNKIKKLISSGIIPTVISPEVSNTIVDYHREGLARLISRDFEDKDIEGAFLVFIATDNKSLNSHINNLCQKKNILCCAVDGDWHNSNFITPASFKEDGVTVSVSTGGKSCRLSRLLKEHIKKIVSTSKNSDLLLIGTDHRFLPLNKREAIHSCIEDGEIPEMLSHIRGLHEFMILNTCNRIELLTLAEPVSGIEQLIIKVLGFDKLPKKKIYIKKGFDAFKHIAFVTSGIYSQLIGENHITAQIKYALKTSEENHWAGSVLKSCVEAALFNSKQIRNSIHSIIKPTEIDSLAIKFLKSLKGIDLKKDPIAILGTGKIGSSIVQGLIGESAENMFWFYNQKIPSVNKDKGIKLLPLRSLENEIHNFKVIIGALRINKPLLQNKTAKNKDIVVIDLGVPRNISPDFSPDIADLEKLKYWFRKEVCSIRKVLPACNKIINSNAQNYEKIFNSLKMKE